MQVLLPVILDKMSTMRKVMDISHKAVVTGLIGLTVVGGVFTVSATNELVTTLRAQRERFIAEQQANAAGAESTSAVTPQ